MGKKISAKMQAAIEYARQHGGEIVRHPGGFWASPGWVPHERPWFGTTTITALVSGEHAEWSGWVNGKKGRSFPVRMRLRND